MLHTHTLASRWLGQPLQKFFENRVKHIHSVQAAGGSAFPHKFAVTHRVADVVSTFSDIETGEHKEDVTVAVAGASVAGVFSGCCERCLTRACAYDQGV